MIGEVKSLNDSFVGKPVRTHVREFAALFALICSLIALVKLYKAPHSFTPLPWLSGAVVLLLLGAYAQSILFPVWKGWMFFAEKLGHVMTFIILSIMWYFVLTPTAIFMRLFGKEVLNRRFREPEEKSYWIARKAQDFQRMEKQF